MKRAPVKAWAVVPKARSPARGAMAFIDEKKAIAAWRTIGPDVVDVVELIESGGHVAGTRCDRCHHTAPNPEGCARCNPDRLGERLREALAELSAAPKVKP